MNRRGFLSRLAGLAAAPLVLPPTLEEIERLGWHRLVFPGWSPALSMTFDDYVVRFAVPAVVQFVSKIDRDWAKPGETIHVRKPQRFVIPASDSQPLPNV